MPTPTVTPFLWFDHHAAEAAAFYTEVFAEGPGAQTARFVPNGCSGGVEFELNGQRFLAFDGGPRFRFNEAISLFISCDTQVEIDYFWAALAAGGSEGRCGWLKDRFGVSWQVVPRTLGSLLGQGRALEAMMSMHKLDLARLEQAAGESR